ncbi:cytochrome P450 [Rhodococcoides trifolii]|uniref:Cytochrome P450 n=1 Tax=Rhodococcoides trifolii TaxID=908250 RepID=A0A917FU52_9NOCA|nr:cytochrome P450 [Rhodococcus trifolii]GGG01485.1 cytochrome P450 [Rhodococcus trifolii]
MTDMMKPVVRSQDRVLPHPPRRLPMLGDVLDLHVTDSSQWGWKGAVEYGPIYERKILGARVTYVSGPDLIAEINNEEKWAKFLGVPVRDLRSVAGDGMFTAHNSEPNWATAHAILAPAFTQAAMRDYHDPMVQTAGELVDYWRKQGEGTWLDVPSDMNKVALEIIGRVAFGYEFAPFTASEPHELVQAMLRIMRYINRAAYSHPMVEATVFRKQRDQHRRDISRVQSLVDDIVARRREQGPRTGRRDLLDLMLETSDPETGRSLSTENIRNQILTFLAAGQETSAGVMAFALHYLSQHPEIADKARGEVMSVCGDSAPTFEQVGKLRYLRRVMDETLRLWPVAPGYFRKAREDTVIGGEHPFEKGEWVFVVLLALHRDAAWGPDAELFDPDRFSRDRVPKNLNELYKPFGTGMRACVGRQFAYHEIAVVLATVLQNFELEADPGYELRVEETITLKPDGLTLRASSARTVGMG